MTTGLPRWVIEAPRVRGVYVRSYKNLEDIWLPWGPSMVLVGPNAAGKTNMLDCCALLMGTHETKRLVKRRVPSDLDFDVSVIIEGDHLVLSPGRGLEETSDETFKGFGAEGTALAKEFGWLRALGARSEEPVAVAASRGAAMLGAPAELLETLGNAFSDGIQRFRLRSVAGETTWTRTLVTGRALRRMAAPDYEVPAPYRPLLRDWPGATRGHDQYTDLLLMPEGRRVPVDLQWLPYSRSEREIVEDLTLSIYGAAMQLGIGNCDSTRDFPNDTFADVLTWLIQSLTGDEVHDHTGIDLVGWLISRAQTAARNELDLTMPQLVRCELAKGDPLVPHAGTGANDCLVSISLSGVGVIQPGGALARSTDDDDEHSSMLDRLSAAERRWFDEAMHSASIAVRDAARQHSSHGYQIGQLVWPADGSEPSGVEAEWIRSYLTEEWDAKGVWDASTISRLLTDLGGSLKGPNADVLQVFAETIAAGAPEANAAAAIAALLFDAAPYRAKVRVIDEPEAHLHSGSIGRISEALNVIAGGADVLVTSHHPRFIYLTDWSTYHLRPNKHGNAILAPFDPTDPRTRAEVAHELGLTTAETLSAARSVLLVEGEHELVILKREPFQSLFANSGVVLIPMRGVFELGWVAPTGDWKSSLALELLLAAFADKKIGLMLDNAGEGQATMENSMAVQFATAANERGLMVEPIRLERPDIVAYLHPEAVGAVCGTEFDWSTVLADYRDRAGSNFKSWIARYHGIQLDQQGIRRALVVMEAEHLAFEPGLVRALNTFVASVGDA